MTIWSQDVYDFVRETEDASTAANPSLLRNTQYNVRYGLFQVTDDIYQVRGYDISNITFARIVAVVISHAYVDYYGGIEGLIGAEDVADASLPPDEQIASGKTAIIEPQGFVDAVMKENVFVGTAMKRRAIYQYDHTGVVF